MNVKAGLKLLNKMVKDEEWDNDDYISIGQLKAILEAMQSPAKEKDHRLEYQGQTSSGQYKLPAQDEYKPILCNDEWHIMEYDAYAKKHGGAYPRSCPSCHSCFSPEEQPAQSLELKLSDQFAGWDVKYILETVKPFLEQARLEGKKLERDWWLNELRALEKEGK